MENLDSNNLSAEAIRLYQEGDFKNAARLFGEAASIFQAQANELDAAEMKNNQSVALLQIGDAHGSYEAAVGTAQVFFSNQDFRRQGMALGNEGAALVAMGRLEEAIQVYQLSADVLGQAGEDQMFASVMQALAGLQLRRGKIADSMLSMRQGLSGVKQPSLKQKILLSMLKIRP